MHVKPARQGFADAWPIQLLTRGSEYAAKVLLLVSCYEQAPTLAYKRLRWTVGFHMHHCAPRAFRRFDSALIHAEISSISLYRITCPAIWPKPAACARTPASTRA
jgi:hypothetical protein